MQRRSFLKSAFAFSVAPAIVQASSLMPIVVPSIALSSPPESLLPLRPLHFVGELHTTFPKGHIYHDCASDRLLIFNGSEWIPLSHQSLKL